MELATIGLDNLPSPNITELNDIINDRDDAITITNKIHSLCKELLAVTDYSTMLKVMDVIRTRYDYPDCEETNRKVIDRHYWSLVLDKTKYGAILTTKQYGDHKKLINLEAPVFSRDRVTGTFISLHESRFESMLSAIAEIHSSLYPCYVNNNGFKFKKKTIISNVFSGQHYSSFSNGKQKFSDFIKYLFLMDGQDISVLPNSDSPANLLGESRLRGESIYSFEQCDVRMYENGNIHILLSKRPDLLERLNNALANYHGKSLAKD